ncbi:homoserine O-succinyltransferase [Hominifimenecus microfluidus]|uniref:homoserine O-acetyltransferase MetA n=1 Tax=Hominifimenecus microfluidus TaxID=2885348 RepID=UPI0032BF679A
MPIRVQNDLPARSELEKENIFVMDENRALAQDIRPLQILILNLMPIKQDTETQLFRAMSNTPLQIDITLMHTSSHTSKNTSSHHLNKFYVTFKDVKEKRFDGMIITGAPVEMIPFEKVDYWDELCEIMEWTKTHVTSTVHVCWGAQAGLYYHYGLNKTLLPQKLSGVYKHHLLTREKPLTRGFDDFFKVPHSRNTTVALDSIWNCPELIVLAKSYEAGAYLIQNHSGSQIFITGHPEYDRMTLDKEYHRDLDAGLNPQIPENYYLDNNPENPPALTWRVHANTLYTNWLNYYVYQETPYIL